MLTCQLLVPLCVIVGKAQFDIAPHDGASFAANRMGQFAEQATNGEGGTVR